MLLIENGARSELTNKGSHEYSLTSLAQDNLNIHLGKPDELFVFDTFKTLVG
jgi:hypothetical protein